MPKALPIIPLCSLGQDNWNNVQCNAFGHNNAIDACVPHDTNCVINGHLLGQENQKGMQHVFFVNVMPMSSSVASVHLLSQDN